MLAPHLLDTVRTILRAAPRGFRPGQPVRRALQAADGLGDREVVDFHDSILAQGQALPSLARMP